MCGITGYYSFDEISDNLSARVEEASNKIIHRGPDDAGFFRDDRLAVAHRRLSILDPSEAGHQPMFDPEKKFLLAYNGECYNFKELRHELKQLGRQFHSESDTEVILNLLIQFGYEGLKKINGFFVIVFYDLNTRSLMIARDRFGIKPLYYHIDQSGVSFSSELKALVITGKRSLNHDAVNTYLHLNYIPAPFTIFNGVKKLRPGHAISIDTQNKVEESRFFDLHTGNEKREKWDKNDLIQLLDRSVQKRLISDVPVSCFLSGGLDSSIITGLASRHHEKLNTYNISFLGNQQYDESEHARLVAKHFNTNHHEIEISERDLIENIPNIFKNSDEPFADSSSIAMYQLCKEVGKDVKVALSGDGGDELFAGYYKHRASNFAYAHPIFNKMLSISYPALSMLPSSRKSGILDTFRKLKRYAEASSVSNEHRYWQWAGFGNDFKKHYLHTADFEYSNVLNEVVRTPLPTFEESLEADVQMVLEGDMLVKADRMGMANSLEVRVPFLDHEFVSYVNEISGHKKTNLKEGKLLLKESFSGFLPNEILNKKKHGFEVPLKKWLLNEMNGQMESLLKDELIEDQNLFDIEGVKSLKQRLTKTNDSNAEYSIWNLMVFNNWWLNHNEMLDQ